MANVTFGNHSSVLVPQQDRDNIRSFYCGVLGGEITKADPERDFIRLGDDFYIGFLYGDVSDESDFLRTFRAIGLEIKSDDVEETRRKILDSGLARHLDDIPDPHLYFQAPGGQCLRLVGLDEDLSFYEGAGAGPDVAKVKDVVLRGSTTKTARASDSQPGADYETTIRVKADPAAVFDALTDASALTAWWSPATGSGDAGGELKFSMNAPEPLVVHVDEATPNTTVRWTVSDCPFLTDWVGTRPTFTITPVDGNECELHFRHHGLSADLDCIEMCTNSWNHFIWKSLREYVEDGRGSPLGSEADKAWRATKATAK